jgi:AcrR family transcriptional regulator
LWQAPRAPYVESGDGWVLSAKRKTQEQRRRETREAVLNAAAQVLTEAGYSRFSAARVAAQAGVSRGALERYFPTRNDLLVAVTEHVMERAMSDARLLAARGPSQEDPINRFLLDSEHFFFSPIYRGMIELAIAAKSDDDLAERYDPIVARTRKELNATWLEALADAGFPRKNAELFVELTHHFLRGVFLVSTWLPYKPNRRALIDAWSKVAPEILRIADTPAPAPSPRRRRAAVPRRNKKA